MRIPRAIPVALVVLAVGACVSDPTSDLRNGPSFMAASKTAVTLKTGDSVDVTVYLKDGQGNVLPAEGATWATGDQTVATVRIDTVASPGEAFTRAFIRGVTATGGITTVTVTSRGVSADVRVTVLPAFLGSSYFSIVGATSTDTLIISRPAPQPPDVRIYTAGDTLSLTLPANMVFDTNTLAGSQSQVVFGANRGYVIARTPAQVRAITRTAFIGRPVVSNVLYAGDAETGVIRIDSQKVDSVSIARARFNGSATVGTSAFGPNTQMTLTPQAGTTFTSTSSVVRFGGTAATILTRTATQIDVIATAAYTGVVTVTNVNVGLSRVDSMKTSTARTISPAFFPGTVVHGGTQRMLDTLYIIGGPTADFTTTDTTTGLTASTASNVTLNGGRALVLRRAADTLYVLAPFAGTSAVAVTNVKIGTSTIPSLTTQGTTTIGTTTGEANEPGNDAVGGATALAFTGATDTIRVYGSIDCEDDGTACPGNGDVTDWFAFTLPTSNSIRAILDFPGNGSANTAGTTGNYCGSAADLVNPDIDVSIRSSTGAGISRTGGAGLVQPEISSTNAAQLAGNYTVRIDAWCTKTPATYRLRILRF